MLSEDTIIKIFDFYNQYEVVFEYMEGNDKKYIADPVKHLCRFCGKSKPEVTFKKVAHAIPEFLGNKKLISKNECDSCNDYFGTALEDHLAKYLGILRTLTLMKGKRGIPVYRANDKIGRIEFSQSNYHVQCLRDDAMISLDEENKSLVINGICQPYIPLSAYQAFVKMALSVIPYDLLIDYSDVLQWIRNTNYDNSVLLEYPCILIEKLIPGPMLVNTMKTFLLRKINQDSEIPYLSFILQTGNVQFQIWVQCPQHDKLILNKNVTFYYYPTFYELNNHQYGDIQITNKDLSSDIIKINDSRPMAFKYGSCK